MEKPPHTKHTRTHTHREKERETAIHHASSDRLMVSDEVKPRLAMSAAKDFERELRQRQ